MCRRKHIIEMFTIGNNRLYGSNKDRFSSLTDLHCICLKQIGFLGKMWCKSDSENADLSGHVKNQSEIADVLGYC